ncbi:MAG TPA: magnesium transporter CorA family protein [Candidatus Paceibacterota bacterium]
MIKTYKSSGETWVDVDHGTPEEIHKLMDEHNIHPFIAKELTSATPKPRIEFHDSYIYCILHFPAWKHTHGENKNQEIDFVIGKDTLITARYDTIDALHKLGKDLEVKEVLDKNNELGDKEYEHSHKILMQMLRSLYQSLFEELESIEDDIEKTTAKIFEKKEKEVLISISEITRTLLEFKRVTDLHHEILESLKKRGKEIFGDEFENEMDSIILDYLKINTTIKSHMDRLRELRDTDNSLLTAKQNETIKKLTFVGAVLFIISIAIALMD